MERRPPANRPVPSWSLAGLLALCISTGCRSQGTEVRSVVDATAPMPPEACASALAVPEQGPPAAVEERLGRIEPERLGASVETLVGFGTRHTLSQADDPERGIGAARRWIAEQMKQHGQGTRLQVELDSHRYEPDGRRIDQSVDVVNVVGVLPGTMPEAADRRYYVIGHYDSRVSDPMDRTSDAPGANDDASGVAVVLELSRILADAELDATVVFMATAGEEQGLLGAKGHARAAADAGLDVRGVLSNDIVGDPSGAGGRNHPGEVRVFSAGLPSWVSDEDLSRIRTLGAASDSTSRQLARYVDMIAHWHALPVRPRLIFRADRFLRGGDHTAFHEAGFPAVRFSEVEENYDRQHQDVRTEGDRRFGDLPEYVDTTYLAGVARLNAATLIHLANAPTPPADVRMVATSLTNDTTLRWSPSPESDVAGYEVLARATTAPTWEFSEDVGKVTEATLDRSKDNWLFAVRAYDEGGYRSPASFAGVER